jgi:hypothetical protein
VGGGFVKAFAWHDQRFIRAIAEHSAATNGDISDSLNRGLKNWGFQAARLTPKETAAQIEAELRKGKLALKIATKQLRGRVGKTYTTKKGKTRTFKRVTRKQIAAKAKRLISKRQKRRGYLRAGWIAALLSAGFKGVNKADLAKGGKSGIGTGKQATENRLRAFLKNNVFGRLDGPAKARIEREMLRALRVAQRIVTNDMLSHAQRKMEKTARKFSGNKRR